MMPWWGWLLVSFGVLVAAGYIVSLVFIGSVLAFLRGWMK